MNIRIGLRIKAIIIVIFIVVLVSFAVTFMALKYERDLVNAQYRERAAALVRNLSYNSEYGLLAGNKDILGNLLNGLIEQPDVLYCAVSDKEGTTVLSRSRPGIPADLIATEKRAGKKLPKENIPAVERIRKHGIEYFDMTLPVWGAEKAAAIDEEQLFLSQEEWLERSQETTTNGPRREIIGFASIGLSLESAKEVIFQTGKTIVGAVLVLTLVLSISSGVGITFVIAPIRKLAAATGNISKGDLDTKVDIRSRDEIGVLADSFNRMAEDLKQTTVSRDYMDGIIKSISDAMIIFTPDGRISSVNEAVCDLLKYKKEDLIGQDVQVLFSKHTVAKLGLMGKGFIRFIQENPEGPYEITFVASDKERVPVLFSASEVYDRSGNLERIVGTGKDITVLRESEEQLRRLNEQLKRNERAVLNILADLKKSHKELESSQEQLVQSEKLASLGRLVSDMAHEVNNPLQIISGRAQLSLMEEVPSEELEDNLNIIRDQCERAKDVIQRLLMFSKPSRGELKDVNVNDAIDFVVKIIEHQFELQNVKIERNYASDLPPVKMDEKQMHEVFMNMVKNSADAMTDGGTITVKTTRQEHSVRIDFNDTGSGIKKEDMEKIFDPFFTTKEHGTGLGLSVCYGIIKAHGGELVYSSEPGQGTTATITLPV